jgi:hypothetical protein
VAQALLSLLPGTTTLPTVGSLAGLPAAQVKAQITALREALVLVSI